MGNEEEKQKTLQGLDRAKGFIRSEVGNRIRLRHTPEIAFFLDKSLDHSMHIEGLLKKIKEEEVNDGK
jgi:ribosome-binding factor A